MQQWRYFASIIVLKCRTRCDVLPVSTHLETERERAMRRLNLTVEYHEVDYSSAQAIKAQTTRKRDAFLVIQNLRYLAHTPNKSSRDLPHFRSKSNFENVLEGRLRGLCLQQTTFAQACVMGWITPQQRGRVPTVRYRDQCFSKWFVPPPWGVEEMQGGGRRVRLEWGAYIIV
ncbi:hypothetical protein FHG87_017741 [Trinorchestia longiramus]|nr:hypothetical protein FHG87_017741 [Trinorchestia longiramus]